MSKKIYYLLTFFSVFIFNGLFEPELFAKKNTELAEKRYERGIIFMNSDLSRAIEELKEAGKLNPKDPKIYVALGQAYFQQHNYKKSIEFFKKAIAESKDYVAAYSNLGYTYMFLKEWDKAIENFKVILNYPRLASPHYVYNALGWAYYEKNDFKKSVEQLNKAIKFKKNYSIAYYNLGLSLLGQEKYDSAIKEFKNAIMHKSDFLSAYNQLALVYLKQNMKNKAKKAFQKVIELNPNNEMAKEAKNYLDILGEK